MTPEEYKNIKERSEKVGYIARPECVALITQLVHDNRALVKFIDEALTPKGDDAA